MAKITLAEVKDRLFGAFGLNLEHFAPLVTGKNKDGTPFGLDTKDALVTPLGFQRITSLSASTGLTVPTGATYALVQPLVANVRWRDDGAAPTAAIGMQMALGSERFYYGDLAAIRFIQESAGATLNVSYYA